MYILNPTKEAFTLSHDGEFETFLPGEVVQVSEDAGRFFLAPLNEMEPLPMGAGCWYGLMEVRHDSDLVAVGQTGVSNWQRLLTHRLKSMGLAIQEAKIKSKEADSELAGFDEAMMFKQDGRLEKWKAWWEWSKKVTSGVEKPMISLVKPEIEKSGPPPNVKVSNG